MIEFEPKCIEEYSEQDKAKAFEYLYELWYANAEGGNLMQQMLAAQYIRMFFDESY